MDLNPIPGVQVPPETAIMPSSVVVPDGLAERFKHEERLNQARDSMPLKQGIELLAGIINTTRRGVYRTIDRYVDNEHEKPYIETGNGEHSDRMKRSVTNFLPLVIQTIQQELYVDGFGMQDEPETDQDIWGLWQEMKLDHLQRPAYEGAIRYGLSYLECTKEETPWGTEQLKAIIHSPRNSAGMFDGRHDAIPSLFVAIDDAELLRAQDANDDSDGQRGWAWDAENKYTFLFESGPEIAEGEGESITIIDVEPHMCSAVPVVRLQYQPDVNGQVRGAILPLIPQQDKINQIWFDLLTAQANSAHVTKFIAGMPINYKQTRKIGPNGEDLGWENARDADGNLIPLPLEIAPGAIITTPKTDVQFGSFAATDVSGYHQSLELAVQHLTATAQVPPHNSLGQIANLSAEALDAARWSLNALIQETKSCFGEALENFMLLALELSGGEVKQEQTKMLECRWRDLNNRNMNAQMDGLAKFAEIAQLSPDSVIDLNPELTQTQRERLKTERKSYEEEALAEQNAAYAEQLKMEAQHGAAKFAGASQAGKPGVPPVQNGKQGGAKPSAS